MKNRLRSCFLVPITLILILSFSLCVSAEENKTAFSLTFSPSGKGSISCTVSDQAIPASPATVEAGKKVTLQATPDKGQLFVSWEVSGKLENSALDLLTPSITFTMPSEDVTVTAKFKEAPSFTLTVEQDTIGGQGFIPGERNLFVQGETVSVEALPYEGFRFVEWVENAPSLELTPEQKTNPKLSFTMPGENVSLQMRFEFITYYFTVKTQGKGEVVVEDKTKNSAGKYECHVGEEIILRATAAEEYIFLNWSAVNGAFFSEYDKDEVTLTCPASDFTVTANFASSVRNLTLSATEGGAILPEIGVMKAGVDHVINLTASPTAGFAFSHWECSSAKGKFENDKKENTTFTMPDEDCTVHAVFVKGGYVLKLVAGVGGSISGKAGTYEMGVTVPIGATAAEGYAFSRWECSVDGAVVDPASAETTVILPGRDVTVTAIFVLTTAFGEGVDPADPYAADGFPWGAIVVIFLLSLAAIALVIVKERYQLSYGYLIKKWFRGLFGKS